MKNEIPQELIDLLPTHFIVAGKGNTGKTLLAKALSPKLMKKHGLKYWLYTNEFQQSATLTLSAASAMHVCSDTLVVSDTHFTDPVPTAAQDYGGYIRIAHLMEPISFEPTEAPGRLTIAGNSTEDEEWPWPVLQVMSTTRYRESIEVILAFRANGEVHVNATETFTVCLAMPEPQKVDLWKKIEGKLTLQEFIHHVDHRPLEQSAIEGTLLTIQAAINGNTSYRTYIGPLSQNCVAVEHGAEAVREIDLYRSPMVFDVETDAGILGTNECALLTIKKWKHPFGQVGRVIVVVTEKDLPVIEQALRGLDSARDQPYAVRPHLRIINKE